MKNLLQLLCLCWLASLAFNSAALTKEQQADGHLLKAQKAYKAGDYRTAVSAFEAIEQLNVNMVDDFHFFYAMALNKSNRLEKSWTEINLYLNKTGRGGSYYQKALDLYQSLSAKRKTTAKGYIKKIDDEKQSWGKFTQDYQLRYSIRVWLTKQMAASEKLIENNNIDAAIKVANDALSKSADYKSKTKSRYSQLKPYQKKYYEVKQAHEMKLVDASIYPMHSKQHTELLKAYETLNFGDFDLYYQIASKRMNKDYPKIHSALNKANTTHHKNISLVKNKIKCESLRSKIDGYKGLSITYNNNLATAESNYAASCGG